MLINGIKPLRRHTCISLSIRVDSVGEFVTGKACILVDENYVFALVDSLVDHIGKFRVVLVHIACHLWPGDDVGNHDQRIRQAGSQIIDQAAKAIGCAGWAVPHVVGASVQQNNMWAIFQCLVSYPVMNLCDGFATDAFVIFREGNASNRVGTVGEIADEGNIKSCFHSLSEQFYSITATTGYP